MMSLLSTISPGPTAMNSEHTPTTYPTWRGEKHEEADRSTGDGEQEAQGGTMCRSQEQIFAGNSGLGYTGSLVSNALEGQRAREKQWTATADLSPRMCCFASLSAHFEREQSEGVEKFSHVFRKERRASAYFAVIHVLLRPKWG
eukprot:1091912-Rhodomonas_salina.3